MKPSHWPTHICVRVCTNWYLVAPLVCVSTISLNRSMLLIPQSLDFCTHTNTHTHTHTHTRMSNKSIHNAICLIAALPSRSSLPQHRWVVSRGFTHAVLSGMNFTASSRALCAAGLSPFVDVADRLRAVSPWANGTGFVATGYALQRALQEVDGCIVRTSSPT